MPGCGRGGPEVLWPNGLRFGCALWILGHLAPGSRAYGLDRVPAEGGFVLAANHPVAGPSAHRDPFRAIHYMAKAELLEMTVIGQLLKWTGAFPVKRGLADREALRRPAGS